MTSDLIEIWHQGKDHEARYGRDLGNGWVVNHPVKKLVLYQKRPAGACIETGRGDAAAATRIFRG